MVLRARAVCLAEWRADEPCTARGGRLHRPPLPASPERLSSCWRRASHRSLDMTLNTYGRTELSRVRSLNASQKYLRYTKGVI